MGSLVKQQLSRLREVAAAEVYHVTFMPCYDKKLEASREDFYSDMLSCHDVDCVITASKLISEYFSNTLSFFDISTGLNVQNKKRFK